ncbi:MAG: HdeD family acid-resistance protein [Thermonemataceae bacterium]
MQINIRLYEHHWWVLIVKGLLAILFGASSLLLFSLSLQDLLMYFGLVILFSGIFTIIASFFHIRKRYWDISLMEGAFDVLFSLFILLLPSITTQAAYIALAIWALLIGTVQLRTALKIRKRTFFRYVFLSTSVLSYLLALLLIFHPVRTEEQLVWWIEVGMVSLGVLVVVGAVKLRLMQRQIARELDQLANR